MKFFQSIRWRHQLWHGLLLALVLVGFGFTAWHLEWTNQLRRIDQELEELVSVVVSGIRHEAEASDWPPQDRPRRAERPGADPPPPGRQDVRLSPRAMSLFEGAPGSAVYYVTWVLDGQESSRSLLAPAEVPYPERISGPRDSRLRGTYRERFHFAPTGGCVLVGRDISHDLAERQRFAWLLAGAGSFVLLLGLVGGWWISSRAIRPIADISAAAVRISTGDLTQRIHTTDADSELGQLATVLNSTFARLDAAFTRQARFTADAAHELRTPVTVMLTHTQNGLDSDCDNAEHREAFEASKRAAQRMRHLIESLLELARLDSGETAAKREPCELDWVAREATELLHPLANEQAVDLEVELAPVRCEGNAEEIGQVVTNLVSNAIYYNRPGGSVRVKVAIEAGAAVLIVSDTGQGIAPEDLPHIFERFYRADKARARRTGRTGLGLAITKAIIEAHGGTIEAATELGHGSTFTVRLMSLPPASELIV